MDLSKYKLLISMHSDIEIKTCLLDLGFRAMWVNDENFFGKDFILTKNTTELVDLPLKKITNIRVNFRDKCFSAMLTPVCDGVEVECYLCQLFCLEQTMMLAGKADAHKRIQSTLGLFNNQLSRIISANGMLDKKINEKKLENEHELLLRQLYNCDKLYVELRNLVDFFDNVFDADTKTEVVELGELVFGICKSCNGILSRIDRYIDIYIDTQDKFYVTLSVNKFKTALLNVIQNALLYSPKKTDLTLKMWGENDTAFISITNEGCGLLKYLNYAPEQQYDNLLSFERIGLGTVLVKQNLSTIGGDIIYSEQENNSTTALLKLPLCKKVDRMRANYQPYNIYTNENSFPIEAFLNEILENEK